MDGISVRSYCRLAKHVLQVQAKEKKTLSTFSFMESLGTIVNFFSKKVKEKVDLIRELSLRASTKDYEKEHMPLQSLGLKNDVSVTESHTVDLKVSKLQLICPNLSWGISFSTIHDQSWATGTNGWLLLADQFGLQDLAEAASFPTVAETDVGGFGEGPWCWWALQNTRRAKQVI